MRAVAALVDGRDCEDVAALFKVSTLLRNSLRG